MSDLVDYCSTWFGLTSVLFGECASWIRRKFRFNGYQRRQRAIHLIVKRFLAQIDQRKSIIYFGDGNWTSAKGAPSVPRKEIIKALARHFIVIVVPEAWTSAKCFCGRFLSDVDGEYRRKVCENEGCEFYNRPFDRDDGGRARIGHRGVVKTFLP